MACETSTIEGPFAESDDSQWVDLAEEEICRCKAMKSKSQQAHFQAVAVKVPAPDLWQSLLEEHQAPYYAVAIGGVVED